MEIRKEIKFEAAHVLSNYCGLCGNLHGHSYTGRITIFGTPKDDGMVMDFNDITNVIQQQLDHAMIFGSDETQSGFEYELYKLCKQYGKKLVVIPYGRSTAENIARYIASCIEYPCKVSLKETATSEVFYG